ncbi:MAG: hypothetical protein JJU16_10285 [Alkalibacterium sp.]|nr:hypothetical protein [Alkalibacterium sp.]
MLSCQETEEEANGSDEPEEVLQMLDLEYESFQKIVGWINGETILIHKGDHQAHGLISHNLFTGETHSIYEEHSYFLSVEISHTNDYILFQEVSDSGVILNIIDLDGELAHSIPINYSGYVTLDWNAVNPELIFLSHYAYDVEDETESILVQIWNTSDNTLTERPIASLYPRWYTSNVYVYVDEFEGRHLYIGDIREEDSDMIISREIRDFFLHQDTFIGVVPSDINEHQVYLFHEYPFLVGDNVIAVPRVTMNNEPMKPHMTQSRRNGTILGVIAEEAVVLEDQLGDYTLQKLDFDNETTEDIIDLPYDAPITLSPDERYVLFGWRYEYIINLRSGEMKSLINGPT